jgi:hypothetical protein
MVASESCRFQNENGDKPRQRVAIPRDFFRLLRDRLLEKSFPGSIGSWHPLDSTLCARLK